MPFAAIGGVISAVAGIGSLIGGIFGASAASRAASGRASIMREQASQSVTEGGINLQRKMTSFTQQFGRSTAMAGASGFQKTGTLDTYLTQLSKSFQSNLTFDQLRIAKTAQLQRQAADITEDTGSLQVASDILGGVSGAAGGLASAGAAMKWWGA